jgi:hypothetical protein
MKRNLSLFMLAGLAAWLLFAVVACETDDDDDNDDDNNDEDDEFEVLSVQPATGPVAGGTAVVVYGRAFTEDCQVFFGDVAGVDTTFTSETEISTTTPPSPTGGSGAVTVKVEKADGQYAELENGFYYGEPGVTIAWCVLKWPEATTAAPGVPSEPIYGQVYVEGCTEEQGAACESVTAQVGYGPEGIDPSVDPDLFDWIDAAYNVNFAPPEGSDEYNNDEFLATITEDAEGVYKYAYRFSGDGGATWTYCDFGLGTDDGFSTSAMGTLTVEEQQLEVGWCVLQYPSATQTPPGTPSEMIYGRVYVAGCTDGANYCAGVLGQVGWGDVGADPSQNPAAFTWTNGAYNNAHVDDNNDEYMTQITETDAGEYAYAYRFSGDGGGTWLYCDLDGSDNGFSTDQMGRLVNQAATHCVDWCNIQWPEATSTGVGDPTENIYGRVYIAGLTGAGSASPLVNAELGYGPEGANPQTDPTSYTWVNAAFNLSVGNDDEYMTTLIPSAAGVFSYVYRFSSDDCPTWTYCDFGPGTSDGFSVSDLGTLTVTARR